MAKQPQQKMRTGKLYAVPCPYPDCAGINDFRDLQDYGLATGNICDCDTCKRKMEITRVEPTTLVSVRQTSDQGNLRAG